MMKLRRLEQILRSLTLALAVSWLGVGCAEEIESEPILRPVRVERVASGSQLRERTFAGVAHAGLESQLSFRVQGTVDRVPVSVGQEVKRGHTLARIDPTDYELKMQEAVAGLAQAEASARNADADYERVRGLYENNNASLRELDGARAQSESGKAQVVAAEKRLEQAQQQLSYCSLRAPVDGTVASVDVEVNENVSAGQKIFLLTAGARAEVEVALPEVLISEARLGQQVVVRFDALAGREFGAEVIEAGVAAIGMATTFPVTVQLTDASPDVRSGMAAEVAFSFDSGVVGDRILVPPVAVGEDRDGRFVFLLERQDDGTGFSKRRPVVVGELTNEGLEVLDGIAEGDLLITAGVRRLVDGQRVRVPEDQL